jgi:Flp pilus assembly protein TadG
MRRLKSLVCDEDGQDLVEFALAAAILFTLIFGIIEFCLVIYTGSFAAYASQQGTRYAMVRGSDWKTACATTNSTISYGCVTSQADVQTYILSLPHPGINLAPANIHVTPLQTTAAGPSSTCTLHPYAQNCQLQVTINYSFSLNIPFIPAAAIPLSGTSVETIQD